MKEASVSGGSIGNAFRLAADDEYWKLREEIMNAFFRNRNRSSVLGFSAAWKDRKSEAPVLFEILEQYVHQLLRYRLYKEKKDFPDTFPEEWQAFAASADMGHFNDTYNTVSTSDRVRSHTLSFLFPTNSLIV